VIQAHSMYRAILAPVLALTLAIGTAPASLVAAQGAGATANAGTVTGTVTNSAGSTVPKTVVRVRTVAGQQVAETTSGVNGSFTVGGLQPGEYIVEVLVDGKIAGTSPTVLVPARGTANVVVVLGRSTVGAGRTVGAGAGLLAGTALGLLGSAAAAGVALTSSTVSNNSENKKALAASGTSIVTQNGKKTLIVTLPPSSSSNFQSVINDVRQVLQGLVSSGELPQSSVDTLVTQVTNQGGGAGGDTQVQVILPVSGAL